ncbi:MAG: hypothetical protein WA974_04120 [Thermodesulfobacteriota bacterium]
MPFFPLTTLQEMALAFFLGLGALVLLYVAWAFYPKAPPEKSREELKKPEGAGSGEEQKKADHPMPPFRVIVYIAVIVWALAYLILVGLRVKAIG